MDSIKDIVDIKEEDNGCWIVLNRKTNSNGYIELKYKGCRILAHRLSYILCNGEIKDNNVIRHTCDNPGCVNPEHLLAGTHQDNVRDRVERGRSATGVKNGRSKLKINEVIKIFKDANTPKTQLSKIYNVHRKAIYAIQHRETWRQVTKDLVQPTILYSDSHHATLIN